MEKYKFLRLLHVASSHPFSIQHFNVLLEISRKINKIQYEKHFE